MFIMANENNFIRINVALNQLLAFWNYNCTLHRNYTLEVIHLCIWYNVL